MQYALFDKPAATIYDLPRPVERDGEGRLRSTIGDEGLYGQSCQVLDDGGPMVQERNAVRMPLISRRQTRSRSPGERAVPVWEIPSRSRTSSVRFSPGSSRSRQWLFAVETRSNPADASIRAKSSGVLKE